MNLNRIGDLAEHFVLRRQNVEMKRQLGDLTAEMASGRRSDLANPLTGDYTYLSDIERSLQLLAGFSNSTREAALLTDAMQNVLELVQTTTTELGRNTLTVAGSQLTTGYEIASQRGVEDFRTLVSALNTTQAGRSLFGGTATGRNALAPADEILAELRAVTSGLMTPGDVVAAVDDWFHAAGGGFETVGYIGATDNLSPAQVSGDTWVNLDLRADDGRLRNVLRDTALIALASDPVVGFSTLVQTEVLKTGAEGLIANQADLTQMRAGVGNAQERIEHARVRNEAERTASEMARTELIAIDPYDTATRLENVQTQLESLYAVTARMSRMSLLDFLR
ncbi:flagellin [Shimia biformata]|uniref:flagellin n=1 Tax=Shimia biformata TaxID=1294299 RepID=UPI0019509869|nr:flagellin [Shimia biformata]